MSADRYGHVAVIAWEHRPDTERHCCQCGFCVTGPDHVAAMVAEAWAAEVAELEARIARFVAAMPRPAPRWLAAALTELTGGRE